MFVFHATLDFTWGNQALTKTVCQIVPIWIYEYSIFTMRPVKQNVQEFTAPLRHMWMLGV